MPPASYRLSRQILLRSLGAIYLIAFTSLYTQIDGLIGSSGILPIRSFLAAVQTRFDSPQRYLQFPTLCWLNPSDAFLHFLCIAGIVASLFVIAGIVQLPALILLYAFYLSLTIAGQDFLGFQWEMLLLEAGFLAIFFAPLHPLAWRSKTEPPRIVLWLVRWLLFRLMFMSGIVKLASRDPTWRSLTALRYHYLTQPLPPWTAWYFYHFPNWFQTFSCAVVFFAELLIPILIFTPRITRMIAFRAIIAFQCLIAITGNYGFFNLLTIVLCFPLVDDNFWRRLVHRFARPLIPAPGTPGEGQGGGLLRDWRQYPHIPLAAIIALLTIPIFLEAFNLQIPWPSPIPQLSNAIAPFRLANGYGLFAVMTTTYNDIVIEGSDDAQTWKPYVFKYKPQDLNQRPQFTTPHMPRLDWQMWFASLGDASDNPWFTLFLNRLLEGSPAVLKLLETNPFPDHPPQFIRAILYEYKFTDSKTRRATGDWWTRTLIRIYAEQANTNVLNPNP